MAKNYEESLYLIGEAEMTKIAELIRQVEEDIWGIIHANRMDDPLEYPDDYLSVNESLF